jgi:chromosome segregation ATPase
MDRKEYTPTKQSKLFSAGGGYTPAGVRGGELTIVR